MFQDGSNKTILSSSLSQGDALAATPTIISSSTPQDLLFTFLSDLVPLCAVLAPQALLFTFLSDLAPFWPVLAPQALLFTFLSDLVPFCAVLAPQALLPTFLSDLSRSFDAAFPSGSPAP